MGTALHEECFLFLRFALFFGERTGASLPRHAFLRLMPGRKIMLLFSEEMSMIQGDNFVQHLGDRAIRSSVAIYTVDPRGLPTLQLTAADDTRYMTPQQILRVLMDRSESYPEVFRNGKLSGNRRESNEIPAAILHSTQESAKPQRKHIFSIAPSQDRHLPANDLL